MVAVESLSAKTATGVDSSSTVTAVAFLSCLFHRYPASYERHGNMSGQATSQGRDLPAQQDGGVVTPIFYFAKAIESCVGVLDAPSGATRPKRGRRILEWDCVRPLMWYVRRENPILQVCQPIFKVHDVFRVIYEPSGGDEDFSRSQRLLGHETYS